MSAKSLAGKVALVTGGNSGIGLAIAQDLAERGVRCALVGRNERTLADAVSGLATSGCVVAVDVTSTGGPDAAAGSVRETIGPIDIVVHSAGIFERDSITDTTDSMWDDTIGVNLTAVMRLTRSAWPDLTETKGQVVVISSIAASQAFADNAAYAASKGGLNSLAGVLAEEGRGLGIRVITLMPGQTLTPIWEGQAPKSVLEKMMPPEAIGALAGHLVASDRSLDYEPITVRPPINPWDFT